MLEGRARPARWMGAPAPQPAISVSTNDEARPDVLEDGFAGFPAAEGVPMRVRRGRREAREPV